MNKVIPVVKPYLPSEKKYNSYISKIFESQWITNSGPLHDEFEAKLGKTLNVRSVILVSNCTLGLQLSYKALNLSGNVITTPFSFAATSSSLAWEGIQPNFSDIDICTPNGRYSDRIQELHTLVMHIIVELVENLLFFKS